MTAFLFESESGTQKDFFEIGDIKALQQFSLDKYAGAVFNKFAFIVHAEGHSYV